ncbi:hypothetical protein QAD02_021999 [Eretmocerus hayati]|uniref:Uncharacterized protein n=1 Tax=Eretmocerus hayati TaxID=131215 RepID=A0ACC2PWM7_9HYME|nr:hypothetical protein QAD02_021999 [Eretmocerus hayati]
MPFGVEPVCTKCETRESQLWHCTDEGNICNQCSVQPRINDSIHSNKRNEDDHTQRKCARVTRFSCKQPNPNQNSKSALKGKGRRHIFKRNPTKSPAATATPVTSNYVFYKGSYFQVGDIVSMQDIDGGIYYAQIRGLLTDQYCEKSAAVTWLLPTTASPPPEDGFRPETYIIGPEEDLPRKLEYMEFVMHAPSDYYKLKNSPYPPILAEGGNGYIWTSLKNELSD